MSDNQENFQIEINVYKKFATQYRPYMVKLKSELCAQLLLRNHPIIQLIERADLWPLGNILDPCPFTVSVTVAQ